MTRPYYSRRLIRISLFAAACGVLFPGTARAADPAQRFVYPGPDGRLVYEADPRGNRVPDFSACGYADGAIPIPDVPVRVTVPVSPGDATARIQAAIDHVSARPPDAGGVRGAVLLLLGRHEVAGQLHIRESGVVLRGQGDGEIGTRLVATGLDRRTLIRIHGIADARSVGSPIDVTAVYVPVGTTAFRVRSAAGLKAGDVVRVEHPSTAAWISALGMDRFPTGDKGSWLDWKPGTRDLSWERTVHKVEGDAVTVDVPLPAALDASLAKTKLFRFVWPGRIEKVGVENVLIESTSDRANPHDEDHAWDGVCFENVRDGWVRRVTFAHLAGSAVAVWESARSVTVADCVSVRPVSEVGGYRRHTYFTA